MALLSNVEHYQALTVTQMISRNDTGTERISSSESRFMDWCESDRGLEGEEPPRSATDVGANDHGKGSAKENVRSSYTTKANTVGLACSIRVWALRRWGSASLLPEDERERVPRSDTPLNLKLTQLSCRKREPARMTHIAPLLGQYWGSFFHGASGVSP
ncbi:hypothetical protein SKAU_G00242600 [Synaphobranchus kaupii]|uniref:Uncharacterized protein n=1 Tax=Synaphobranchus kaupii TaxID=118154 RepID=A0A9Q1F8C8_SYNKA|nr:hypothetical protein SKAU_G00242600 [Synaphobranchus kaupii]